MTRCALTHHRHSEHALNDHCDLINRPGLRLIGINRITPAWSEQSSSSTRTKRRQQREHELEYRRGHGQVHAASARDCGWRGAGLASFRLMVDERPAAVPESACDAMGAPDDSTAMATTQVMGLLDPPSQRQLRTEWYLGTSS